MVNHKEIGENKPQIPLEAFQARAQPEDESDPPSSASVAGIVPLLPGRGQEPMQPMDSTFKSAMSPNQKRCSSSSVSSGSSTGKELVLNMDGQPPKDHFHLVYIIMMIHGVSILMPWNMFINASAYFEDYKLTEILKNGTKIDSPYKEYFMSNLGIAAQLPNVLFNILNIFFQFGGGNLNIRILISIASELIFIIFTVALAVIDTTNRIAMFFYLTMATVVLLNMVSGIYQNSLYGLASRLPMTYTNAIITGANICGVLTSLVNILSIWISPDLRLAAIYYFASAIVILFVAFVSFLFLPTNVFFRHHLSQGKTEVKPSQKENVKEQVEQGHKLLENSAVVKPQSNERPPYLYVLSFAWRQCLNVFLVFFVTLSTFPAIQSGIQAVNPDFLGSAETTNRYFVAVCCFLTFNFCAMIGNIIPNFVIFPGPDRLWVPVVARFLFIPFFVLCNFVPDKRRWPVLIQSDLLYVFGNVLMALSSGYYSSLSMMFASKSVPDPKYAGFAGMMTGASLASGIFFGVNFSLVLSWLVKK